VRTDSSQQGQGRQGRGHRTLRGGVSPRGLKIPLTSEAQTWQESFAAGRIGWLAEYVYRCLIRVPIQLISKGLPLWWWLYRLYPNTGRAFPACVGGIVLSVTLEDHVGRAIFYGRGPLRYEPEATKVLLRELRSGDSFLDGGASFGWYTALAVMLVGPNGTVCSVEANGARARVLGDALRRGKIGNATVIDGALGASPGWALLGQPFGDARESQNLVGLAHADFVTAGAQVEVITLDSLELQRLDVVKLDIEGSEVDAILGASETIRRTRPRLMLIEALGDNLGRRGRTLEDLGASLDAVGYTHGYLAAQPEDAPMWVCRRLSG
jgi:FkbM family methyltransferase